MSGLNALEMLVEPAVTAAGYRLVRLRLKGGERKILQIMAERADGGMDVEDCAALSRAVSLVLDAADPMAEEYVLEVSSPGIDRPLTRLEDFTRFSGYEARVELKLGVEGRKRFKGLLAGTEGDGILMDGTEAKEAKRFRIPFSDVSDAKLVLTDRLIAEDLKARKLRETKVS